MVSTRGDELTYKDFKIGQIVTCVKNDDFYQLEIGKQYKVVDLESRFPDAIGIRVREDYCAFFPINIFTDLSAMRIMKIDKLLDSEQD